MLRNSTRGPVPMYLLHKPQNKVLRGLAREENVGDHRRAELLREVFGRLVSLPCVCRGTFPAAMSACQIRNQPAVREGKRKSIVERNGLISWRRWRHVGMVPSHTQNTPVHSAQPVAGVLKLAPESDRVAPGTISICRRHHANGNGRRAECRQRPGGLPRRFQGWATCRRSPRPVRRGPGAGRQGRAETSGLGQGRRCCGLGWGSYRNRPCRSKK